jgi:phosphoglycerate dehydrogenase-like enzyme
MFRGEQFRQMKPTGTLINIGRGAIVDLTDLARALEVGEIGGAALDVFETEPLPAVCYYCEAHHQLTQKKILYLYGHPSTSRL